MLTRRSLIGLAGALAGASSLAAWLGPALSLAGCGDDQNDRAVDRGPVLDALVDRVMTPALTDLRDRGDALPPAIEALASGPTVATLGAARTAWGDAHGAWRRTSAYAITPSSPSGNIDVTGDIIDEPTLATKLEALLTAGAPVDLRSQPAQVRGFLALEYLLFDPSRDDAAVVATFTGEGSDRRVALLRALVDDLHSKLSAVADGWLKSDGFLVQVRTAGKGSAVYPTQKDAFDALLNQTLATADRLIDVTRKSASLPGLDAKAPTTDRSDRTLADLLDDLAGIDAVYGTGTGTISSIVLEVDAATDQAMHAAIADVRASLTAFTPPLRGAGADRAATANDLITRQRALKSLLNTTIVNKLGITPGFTDKDGD